MKAINIHGEIRKMIADCIERGEARSVASFVDTIMAKHSAIAGDDADFYLICARHRIKEIVSTTIGKFQPKARSVDRQLVLDGFKHLQTAYTFDRMGETVLVPVDQCTDAELRARAQEFTEMMKGCRDHAREILEYVDVRSRVAEAALVTSDYANG